MFLGHLHSLLGFSMLFRASFESIEMYKDLNWSVLEAHVRKGTNQKGERPKGNGVSQ